MRGRSALTISVLGTLLCASGCGTTRAEPVGRPTYANITLQSKLLGKPVYDVLITPAGGGKGRPLLVFLHGYGASPSDTVSLAFLKALKQLGDKAPVVFLPEGDVGWWHDDANGPWGTYVLKEAIPAALKRSGADPNRVAIGGISMGGFGALDLGRIEPKRFCAVGGHSPAIGTQGSEEANFAFDSPADFAKHDLIRIARNRSPFKAPVWIDVGEQDPLRPAVTTYAHELQADGGDVSFHTWPGAHTGQYWDAHFAQYLDLYVKACG